MSSGLRLHDGLAQRAAPCALTTRRVRAGRERGENNENHTFCNGTDAIAAYDRSVFQQVAGKIRYLAEQWNFAADQRICAALSIEKQWNLSGVRNRRIVVTSQGSPPWQEQVELILIPLRGAAR
jgi:hypothetical protein